MTEYRSVNVELSDFQLDKLKSLAKNPAGSTFLLSSGVISICENNSPHNFFG